MRLFNVVAILLSSSLVSFTYAVQFDCVENGTLPITLTDSLAEATAFFSANADGLDDVYTCTSSDITGSFPAAASVYQNLATLKSLTLVANNVVGTIPADISSLTDLVVFIVGLTGSTGSIPSSIGALAELTTLVIAFNEQMTGSIPSSLIQLTKLENLFFSGMSFAGQLPPLPTSLSEFHMPECSIASPLPSGFAQYVHMSKFNLSRCGITGPLPDDIFNMTELSELELDKNRFTGTVPVTISNLRSSANCFLDGNDFSGTMPDHTCTSRIPVGFDFDAAGAPSEPPTTAASNDFPVAIVVGVVAVVVVVGLLAVAFATFRKRAKVAKRKSKHILEPAAYLENNGE